MDFVFGLIVGCVGGILVWELLKKLKEKIIG